MSQKYKVPCGRVLGHGEYCTEGYLCGGCRAVESLVAENNRMRAALIKLSGFDYATDEKIAIARDAMRGGE